MKLIQHNPHALLPRLRPDRRPLQLGPHPRLPPLVALGTDARLGRRADWHGFPEQLASSGVHALPIGRLRRWRPAGRDLHHCLLVHQSGTPQAHRRRVRAGHHRERVCGNLELRSGPDGRRQGHAGLAVGVLGECLPSFLHLVRIWGGSWGPVASQHKKERLC